MTAFSDLRISLIALLVTGLSACTTVQEPVPTRRPTGPVVERPPTLPPTQPLPTEGEGEREPEETVERDPQASDPTERVRDGLAPAHLVGADVNRLGLLLPFSSQNARLREEANSMLRAAELALFERDDTDTVLIVLDTQGTSSGAAQAAAAALTAGADVLLGPILANEVQAVSAQARRANVPVIAFSTDQTVAGNGTYLLSFPPEAEVARIVDYAASTGATNFAILRPENAYGQRVHNAYRAEVARRGGSVTAADSYNGDTISAMQGPAQRMAEFYARESRASGPMGKQPFEVVLLPEGGTALRSLAPLMPYYNSDIGEVQYLGTALWMREDTAREPALSGGLFAGPDRDTRDGFEGNYERAFGQEPSRLASLAHDAVDVGAVIADGDPREKRARAEDYRGFFGADGFVNFNADGTPNRGLAVYEIRGGQFRIVDPAPTGPIGVN